MLPGLSVSAGHLQRQGFRGLRRTRWPAARIHVIHVPLRSRPLLSIATTSTG